MMHAPVHHRQAASARRRRAVRIQLALSAVVGLIAALFVAVGTSAPAHAAASWPTTKQSSSRSANAMTVQYLLTARGYSTTADGAFGSGTKSNVIAFQRSAGLEPDGVVGPATWPKLVITVASGSSNTNAVKAAQTQLNKYGSNLVVDGDFGPATKTAVINFQKSRGLATDGSVGPITWRELTGYSQSGDQTACYYSTGGSTWETLNSAQHANAKTIVTSTKGKGFNRDGQIIAVMTAMQESRLCNIQFGDRDSVGLFQQRPSQGWCSGGAACMRPVDATYGFLGVSSYTNNRGLTDIAGWQTMPKWKAADSVQRSCCPEAYAKWEPLATSAVNAYGG